MRAEKNVAISFRVSRRFKDLLDTAAARENRSKTNMLETLLFAYCEEHGVTPAVAGRSANSKPQRRQG